MAPAPADPAYSRRIRPRHIATAVLFLATLAVFSAVRNHQFLNIDDGSYVYSNAVVTRGLTTAGLRWAFTSFDAANWHPLTWLSHMLDAQIFGPWAGGHHLTSVLIHALSAALLFQVLWGMTAAVGRSAFVAALFSLHPLRVESVAWVAERKDVLSGLFWMLTLLAYLRWIRLPRPGRYLAVITLFALGLLSKPMLVTLPFVLLLLDFWPLGRMQFPGRGRGGTPDSPGIPFSRLLLEKAPLLALAAASSVVTVIAQKSGGALRSVHNDTLAIRVANALHSYVAYLGKTFRPKDLVIMYPHTGLVLNDPAVLAAGLVIAAITLVAVRASRTRPYVLTGWLWYLGTLVPTIGLVQVSGQSMADRYTYLPLIGVFSVIAWGVPDLLPALRHRALALAAAAGAVLILLCSLTIRQVETMRDDETVFRHMLAVDPGNHFALQTLGVLLIEHGRTEEAAALMSGAYRQNPRQLSRLRQLEASQLALDGKLGEALEQYSKALEFDPENLEAQRAVAKLKGEGVRIPPGGASSPEAQERGTEQEAQAWFRQGNIMVTTNQYALAIIYYQQAVRLKPDFADAWNNLGSCYGTLGRHQEAAAAFEKALAADPGNERARKGLEQARRSLRR